MSWSLVQVRALPSSSDCVMASASFCWRHDVSRSLAVSLRLNICWPEEPGRFCTALSLSRGLHSPTSGLLRHPYPTAGASWWEDMEQDPWTPEPCNYR